MGLSNKCISFLRPKRRVLFSLIGKKVGGEKQIHFMHRRELEGEGAEYKKGVSRNKSAKDRALFPGKGNCLISNNL